MKPPMNAIPTVYNGVQFKSRMEAQCAFLFDRIGWDWKYEPDSIMLSSGVTFIPDFSINGGNLIVECRGYNNKRGDSQIVGFVNDLPAISRRRDEYVDFLVMGPDECSFYKSNFDNAQKHDARLTYCVRCGTWSLSPFSSKAWQSLCPRCVQITFNEYPLTVKAGKFFIASRPFEDAKGIFDLHGHHIGWLCSFFEHVCESLNRPDLLRVDQPDALELSNLLDRLLKTESHTNGGDE